MKVDFSGLFRTYESLGLKHGSRIRVKKDSHRFGSYYWDKVGTILENKDGKVGDWRFLVQFEGCDPFELDPRRLADITVLNGIERATMRLK